MLQPYAMLVLSPLNQWRFCHHPAALISEESTVPTRSHRLCRQHILCLDTRGQKLFAVIGSNRRQSSRARHSPVVGLLEPINLPQNNKSVRGGKHEWHLWHSHFGGQQIEAESSRVKPSIFSRDRYFINCSRLDTRPWLR